MSTIVVCVMKSLSIPNIYTHTVITRAGTDGAIAKEREEPYRNETREGQREISSNATQRIAHTQNRRTRSLFMLVLVFDYFFYDYF